MSKTYDTVQDFLAEQFFAGDKGKVDGQTPLMSSGIVDSISALQLVEFLEDKFKIEFEAHEVDSENLENLDTIVAFIGKKQNS